MFCPIHCVACEIDAASLLCDSCSEQILSQVCIKCKNFLEDGSCRRCASEMNITGFRVLAPYSVIKPWIYSHKLNLNHKPDLMDARRFHAIFETIERSINKPFSVEIVPSENRNSWIENILPNFMYKRIGSSALKRIEDQLAQKYLNREERSRRRRGLFKVRQDISIRTDAIVLIDDVMSTGATLECCISLLLGLGYKEVYVVVFAYQDRLYREKYGH